MKPEPAKFTKDQPCSKVEIFLCFWGRRGFKNRQVYEAEAEIGRSVPRHMISADRLVIVSINSKDMYSLTTIGKEWLRAGLIRYLKNHPDRIPEVWDKLPSSMRSSIQQAGEKHG